MTFLDGEGDPTVALGFSTAGGKPQPEHLADVGP